MVEILEASYQAGARGIEAIPIGSIIEACRIMVETYKDYIVTGSTYPGRESGIEDLMKVEAKIIFVHGMISDMKDRKLIHLLEEVKSRGAIPGIATHEPLSTINYAIDNSLNVRAFLIPFNALGEFMGNNVKDLEKLVDNTNNYHFIGMKTLAAGRLDPITAYEYIAKHNICSVTIGMVTPEEAMISTKTAIEKLSK